MPPIVYKDPKPKYLKAPRGRIVPLVSPDVPLGKSIVANVPQRLKAVHLENMRLALRKYLGKQTEIRMGVFATYPVTKKPTGTGMNQGKGLIDHFVARVPAGKAIVHLPGWMSPFSQGAFAPQLPVFEAFSKVAYKLPIPVTFRSQNNHFPQSRFDEIQSVKLAREKRSTLQEVRCRLLSKQTSFISSCK